MKYKPKNRDELEELIYDENIYLGDIDTSLVDDMSDGLLWHRDNLDGISGWNVHNVACMVDIFMYRKHNENLDGWLTDNPNADKICNALFEQIGTKNFPKAKEQIKIVNGKYQPIHKWELVLLMFDDVNFKDIDTSKITKMDNLFFGYKIWEDEAYVPKEIENWDVSNVETMELMFFKSLKGIDLSKWDVRKVKNMREMFALCDNVEFDISKWNVSYDCDTTDMFGRENLFKKYGRKHRKIQRLKKKNH